MSYCVNCGVKLAASEKRCPLCGTVVINRTDPWKEPETKPYPDEVEQIRRVDKKYAAYLIGLIALIPALTCLVTDLMISHGITWSAYACGGILTLYLILMIPFVLGGSRKYISIPLCFVAAASYVALVSFLTSRMEWFPSLGFPLTFLVFAYIYVIVYIWGKKDLMKLTRIAFIIALAGFFVMGIEIIIRRYIKYGGLTWSLIVLIPCLLIAAMLLLGVKQKKIKEEIEKKLFF